MARSYRRRRTYRRKRPTYRRRINRRRYPMRGRRKLKQRRFVQRNRMRAQIDSNRFSNNLGDMSYTTVRDTHWAVMQRAVTYGTDAAGAPFNPKAGTDNQYYVGYSLPVNYFWSRITPGLRHYYNNYKYATVERFLIKATFYNSGSVLTKEVGILKPDAALGWPGINWTPTQLPSEQPKGVSSFITAHPVAGSYKTLTMALTKKDMYQGSRLEPGRGYDIISTGINGAGLLQPPEYPTFIYIWQGNPIAGVEAESFADAVWVKMTVWRRVKFFGKATPLFAGRTDEATDVYTTGQFGTDPGDEVDEAFTVE
ncbi:capsid protein [Gopherus associated circular DNA virus 1]|uniref:capsid protein n=1 Tax=Gopherus associated circular DNA virus 1 TaxID=2041419 RepID=UPI000EB6183E|nr:capsid protein [Gopherus associated circular DNA virus 1]ATG71339.1 capsid protein [Gopherus associated circular DNA virus 1]